MYRSVGLLMMRCSLWVQFRSSCQVHSQQNGSGSMCSDEYQAWQGLECQRRLVESLRILTGFLEMEEGCMPSTTVFAVLGCTSTTTEIFSVACADCGSNFTCDVAWARSSSIIDGAQDMMCKVVLEP